MSKPVVIRGSEDKRLFVKTFRQLTDAHPAWEIWSDFITMFADAISNSVDRAHYEVRESQYMKIISKYRKEEQAVFPELAAGVVNALENEPEQDFLGSVYMELELGNHWIGQFFTPYDVCRCMASVTTGNVLADVKANGYITLNDCACGAGATLIAGVHEIGRQLKDAGYNWQNHVLVAAQDIDFTTGMMCYIQLSLLGCAGYVKIGNTLTDPMHEGDSKENYWYTPMYFSEVWTLRRHWQTVDRLFQSVPQASEATPQQVTGK